MTAKAGGLVALILAKPVKKKLVLSLSESKRLVALILRSPDKVKTRKMSQKSMLNLC